MLEVRILGPNRFLVVSEVLIGGEPLSPSAMIAEVDENGKVVSAQAYLTDLEMLTQTGILADAPETARAAPGRNAEDPGVQLAS